MFIADNIHAFKQHLPSHVSLIAVSKTKPVEALLEAYQAGQRLFGENKAQEMVQKASALPADVEWHFIGHLQTNKVKMIAPVVHTIHSIDSFKLLAEVNREAERSHRVIRCLLQFHIATEETKFGLDEAEGDDLIRQLQQHHWPHIVVAGVMGMATFTESQSTVRAEFRQLRHLFTQMKERWFASDDRFCEISMGMSGDYQIAVEEGSTCVRIGTAIFGERNYTH